MGKQWSKIFKQYGKVFTRSEENIPKIVKLFKKKGVKRVLDLGCGSGRHLIYLAKNNFEVYGIDISSEGIKIAKKWLKNKGLRADLKIGDIYKKLPYKDNFFDAVISTNTIHHGKIENIRKTIKETERILKPKKLIFITVRKRKIKKRWLKNIVITEKYENREIKHKVLAEPRSYMPIEGGEKGLFHYLFNKKILRQEFKNFKIYNIWVDSINRHYCLLGELKSKNAKN